MLETSGVRPNSETAEPRLDQNQRNRKRPRESETFDRNPGIPASQEYSYCKTPMNLGPQQAKQTGAQKMGDLVADGNSWGLNRFEE